MVELVEGILSCQLEIPKSTDDDSGWVHLKKRKYFHCYFYNYLNVTDKGNHDIFPA